MSFEVTFEVFETKFFNRFSIQRQYRKLSANIVWTEIYSVIKGGIGAAKSVLGYLQCHDYLSLNSGNSSSFLTGGEKGTFITASCPMKTGRKMQGHMISWMWFVMSGKTNGKVLAIMAIKAFSGAKWSSTTFLSMRFKICHLWLSNCF